MAGGDDVARLIEQWHGIEPPNAAAFEFARDLDKLGTAFRALPEGDFGGEPADYAAVLDALAEEGAAMPGAAGHLADLDLSEAAQLLAGR